MDVITLKGFAKLNANKIAGQYGKPAKGEFAVSLLNQWERTVQSLKLHPKARWKKSPPDIHVQIVSNNQINAFACAADDGYAIVIFSGLVRALGDLFCTLLADPRSYPAIGLSQKEEPAPEPVNVYYSLAERFHDEELRMPLDPYRTDFAMHMTGLALRFAFNHELYHVLLGHVDLHDKSKPLFEFGPSNVKSERNHAIEMHADECAFRNCVHWILDSMDGTEIVDPMTFYVNTIDAQILDFFAATYTLFQLFDSIESNSHPNPVHRQSRLGLILDYIVDFYGIHLDHPATQIVGTVINNVDLYMEDILGVNWEARRKETARILTTDINTELLPYSAGVRSLYPELEPIAYIDVE